MTLLPNLKASATSCSGAVSTTEIPAASMLASLTFRWESYADYLEALEAQPLG